MVEEYNHYFVIVVIIRKGETVYLEADKSSRLAAAEKVEGTWDNRVVTHTGDLNDHYH